MKAKNAIVGAKVKIKRSSKWYSYDDYDNPKDTTGTITSFNLGADLEGILALTWIGVTAMPIVTVY